MSKLVIFKSADGTGYVEKFEKSHWNDAVAMICKKKEVKK